MRNFGTLFGYEMKKIWKRPLLWAAVLLCAAAYVYISPIPAYYTDRTFTAMDADGNEISRLVTAEEQFRAWLEGSRSLSGQPMDEAFFQAAQAVPSRKTKELLDDVQKGYFFLIDPSYYAVYAQMGSLIEKSAESFYDWRDSRLAESAEFYGLSDADIAYWQHMEEQVEKPFVYQPVQGPSRLVEVLSLLSVAVPILVGLSVCDLFSQERRARTYPQIFSSRQGRSCLYWAKILAGGVSAMLATAMIALAAAAAGLALYGPWGWDGAIQLVIWLGCCSWPVSLWQSILILVGLLMVYALLCGALTSAVSMWTGSGVAALAASAAVTAGNLVLTSYWHPDPASFVEQLLYARLPACFVNITSLLNLRITHLLGLQFNWLQSGVLLYLAAAAAFTGLCWLGWRQYVSGRGQI